VSDQSLAVTVDDVKAVDLTPWKTVPQVAAIVQVGTRQVYRAIHRGDLRAAKIGARGDLRIHESWISEWLERLATPVEVRPPREVRR
jgi:excisionase family DNA binding protein